jgi:hypothetical protein
MRRCSSGTVSPVHRVRTGHLQGMTTMVEEEQVVSTMALPGLARALVAAGVLPQQTAEDIYVKAQTKKTSFVSEVIASGAVSSRDLAHTMSLAFAAPLVDLDAVDVNRLPKDVLDPKICQQFRLLVLSKRSNRVTVATADPSNQQAAEKIKFATQLGVDWVIAEVDKLSKLVEKVSSQRQRSHRTHRGRRLRVRGRRGGNGLGRTHRQDFPGSRRRPDRQVFAEDAARCLLDAGIGPAFRTLRALLPGALSGSMANCAKSPRRPSPSRKSWLRASKSSQNSTSPKNGFRKTGA